MDASPDVLAEEVRNKRIAIDNDLELLRQRLKKADPRQIDTARWARVVVPVVAGAVFAWAFVRRRRPVRSLDHLLRDGASELYEAEQALVPALARMRDRASNPDLQHAFDRHMRETEGHIDRLTRVFRAIEMRPRATRTSGGITRIVAEGERLLKGIRDRDLIDASLIATAQKVEHVEIALYGTLRTYADTLGYARAAQLLQQTLDEERAADATLTGLAERFVNPQASRTTSR